ELEISKRSYRLKMAETELVALDAAGADTDPDKRVRVLRNLSNQQTHLSEATQKRLVMSRLQTYVLPWLPRDRFDTLAAILGVLLVATLLKGICMFVQECLVGSVVELTIIGIRKDCLRKALRLDYQTLTKGGTAKLMSHFTYDMEVMGQGLNLIGGKVV